MSLHYLLSSLKRPKKPAEPKLQPKLQPESPPNVPMNHASKPKAVKLNGKPRPATLGASASSGSSGWKA